MMKYSKKYLPVISVFCLALIVRIVYNDTAVRGYVPIFDAAVYNNIAHNIVTEHCYCYYSHHATVSRAPLWPFIIAAIDILTGEHSAHVRLFLCFLGSGTCVFVYLLAKDLFGKRVALITGVIAALYPGLFYWDGWLYAESLYTFCLTAFTYSLYRLQQTTLPTDQGAGNRSPNKARRWRQSIQWRWVVLAGIFLALATLTRPNGPGLLGVLFLWAVIIILAKIMPWQVVVKSVLVIVVIAAMIIAPWTIRNYRVTHAFVLVSTGVGEVLVGAYDDEVFGSSPIAHGLWLPPPHTLIHDSYRYTPADETKDIERAFTWIRSHLDKMPYLLALHLKNMWSPTTFVFGLPTAEFPDRWSAQFVWKLIPVTSIPIFLLAALGLVVTWKRRKGRLLLIYLVLAMTMAENVVFYGSMRFRSPIEPLLVLLAGGVIWWVTCDEPGTLRSGFRHFKSGKAFQVSPESSQREEEPEEMENVPSVEAEHPGVVAPFRDDRTTLCFDTEEDAALFLLDELRKGAVVSSNDAEIAKAIMRGEQPMFLYEEKQADGTIVLSLHDHLPPEGSKIVTFGSRSAKILARLLLRRLQESERIGASEETLRQARALMG